VIWAPQVIEDARNHGLVLAETGRLYDTAKGESLPEGTKPMPPLTDLELSCFPEVPVEDVVRAYVARYWDLMALARDNPAKVIGEHAILKDKPGFEVDFLTRGSVPDEMQSHERHTVLIPMRGHWKLRWQGGETVLNPGDTALMNPGQAHALSPSVTGEASLYRIAATGDPAGSTWTG